MKKLTLKIFRRDPSIDDIGSYQKFRVPVENGMVVLDAVRYVQESIDPTLSIRWNCKAARCGSCSAEINGRPRLMCRTRVDTLGDEISVSPLKAYPLVKDLVTDVSSNYEIDRRIPAFKLKKGTKGPLIMQEMDVIRSQEFRKCIECFLCQDVCHVIREHATNYIGPRHVVKVASLDMHPMDSIDRSPMLNKDMGLGFCNITKCCQEVCPEGIKITDDAIIPEKERVVDYEYDPLMWIVRKLKVK